MLAALAAVLLLGPRTSIPNAPLPDARVSPEIGVGGSAVAAPAPRIASARVVGDGGASLPVGGLDGREQGPVAPFGISQGRPVALAAPAPSPAGPPQSEPAPEPVSVPAEPGTETAPPSTDPSFAAGPGGGSKGWRGTAAGDVDPTLALASIQVREGDEYALAFSFLIEEMVYGEPGADNLIMRLKSRPSESHNFGLQLWDYAGDNGGGGRGLWSSGDAMGGERFLAPLAEQVWHDVIVHFEASSQGSGFYAIYLDGVPLEARDGVSMIVPGSDYAQIEVGLLRQGEPILGTSELRLDAVRVGDSLASVLP